MRLVGDRLSQFLREHQLDDFTDATDFARRLLSELERAWGNGWASARAQSVIAATTRTIYEFYRLYDTSVFEGKSPVRLRLGGPDRVSIRFVDKLDHFYFSKFADNNNRALRKFFMDKYFENGAALFGRETSEGLDDFRKAAGDKLKNLTDRQIHAIVHTSVARVRNWAHIGTMHQAEVKLARLNATIDERTSELCLSIDGKLLRVGVAFDAIQRLNRLEPKEFADELYGSDLAKQVRQDPSAVVRDYLEDDGKTISDELVGVGLGFPPFHTFCRTRMEAVIAGVDDDAEE